MLVEKQLKKKLNKTVKRAKKEEANLEKVNKEAKEEQELQKQFLLRSKQQDRDEELQISSKKTTASKKKKTGKRNSVAHSPIKPLQEKEPNLGFQSPNVEKEEEL